MAKKRQTETQRLRKFGLVMAAALAFLGGLLLWRQRPAGPYVLYAGATFLVAAVAMPGFLAPIEKAWMALAKVLQTVVTGVILVLTFFLRTCWLLREIPVDYVLEDRLAGDRQRACPAFFVDRIRRVIPGPSHSA